MGVAGQQQAGVACAGWLKELRRLCGLGEAEQGVEWRGESFRWAPATQDLPDHVMFYVWVGPMPAGIQPQAVRRLLWLQLRAAGPSTPVFGCEPVSGQMVIAQAVPWAEVSPVQALGWMALLADLAGQGREVLQSHEEESAGRVGGTSAARQRQLPRWWQPQAVQAD